MSTPETDSLLGRVAQSIGSGDPTPSGRAGRSILSQAAASFAKRPTGAEATIPTGFDPMAASLFEAVVEAAFLVANADGVFDATERQTFERVVAEACQNTVQGAAVHALVDDLCEQLNEDGLEQRIAMVAGAIRAQEHRLEVLRIAALMAHISGGVADTERRVLEKLCASFMLPADSVDRAILQAQHALTAR